MNFLEFIDNNIFYKNLFTKIINPINIINETK